MVEHAWNATKYTENIRIKMRQNTTKFYMYMKI